MKNKHFIFIFILCFFAVLLFAQQNEVIVPVIKSPYKISSLLWDKKGDSFAYTTNGNVYVRDFLSLELKDYFSANSQNNLNPFINVKSSVNYPSINITASGNKVSAQIQENASSNVENKTFEVPFNLKNAAINKSKKFLACLGIDDNFFVYDIKKNNVITTLPHNSTINDIFFTKNDTIVYCDSEKTVSEYSKNGQKLKTYTCSKTINGFTISPDNEDIVLFDNSGILHFYNFDSTKQYGYSPNFNTKNIQEVQLSKDSKKILIRTNDSLYVTSVSDILYAQDNIAPKIKTFPINYNISTLQSTQSNVTEFKSDNITQFINEDAEYITSTKEKKDGSQVFDLQDKPQKNSDISLIPKADDKYYPASEEQKSRTEYFTNKDDVINNGIVNKTLTKTQDALVQEALQKNNSTNSDSKLYSEQKKIASNNKSKIADDNPKNSSLNDTLNQTNKLTDNKESNENLLNKINNSFGSGNNNTAGDVNSGKNEKSNGVDKNNDTSEKKEDAKAKKETKKKTNEDNKTEKTIKDLFKNIKEYDDENIKTMFKDGHGLMFNIGAYKSKAPFPVTFMTLGGYRNYDLIRPFYFGGTMDIALSIPSNNFSFSYTDAEGNHLNNPFLIAAKIYAPIGFCMYPLKNSFEVFCELGFGLSLSGIWSGGVVNNFLMTKLYPAFYTNFRTGVAWDFINLSLVCSYDAILGFNYGIELGAIINIGGSRTIGSMIMNNKKNLQ